MTSLPAVTDYALSDDLFVMVMMIAGIILMNNRIAVSFFCLVKYYLKTVSLVSIPCEGSSIRCNSTGACLPFWKGCNGVDNCGDESDETNCKTGYLIMNTVRSHPNHVLLIVLGPSSPCADDEFQCHTLHCIPMAARCDGLVDCSDQSDEVNCGKQLFGNMCQIH